MGSPGRAGLKTPGERSDLFRAFHQSRFFFIHPFLPKERKNRQYRLMGQTSHVDILLKDSGLAIILARESIQRIS
jgi:hypothetical protein